MVLTASVKGTLETGINFEVWLFSSSRVIRQKSGRRKKHPAPMYVQLGCEIRNATNAIIAIKEMASEISSHACTAHESSSTPPQRGHQDMCFPWLSQGYEQHCLWILVLGQISPARWKQWLRRTAPPPESSPVQTWFSPYSLCHRLLLFSPVDASPACLLAAQDRCLPGKLKEHWYKRILLSKYRISGWGFPETVSSYWGLTSHQGQALRRS